MKQQWQQEDGVMGPLDYARTITSTIMVSNTPQTGLGRHQQTGLAATLGSGIISPSHSLCAKKELFTCHTFCSKGTVLSLQSLVAVSEF